MLGVLTAACDLGHGENLADALHPRLRGWVFQGGCEAGWEEAVSVLGGTSTNAVGALGKYNFEAAASLVREAGVQEACQWVRDVEPARRGDAFWNVSQVYGSRAPDEYLHLLADALDSQIAGLSAVQAANTAAKFIDPRRIGDALLLRRRPECDVPAVGLVRGIDTSEAPSLLTGLRDGTIVLTSGGAGVYGDSDENRGWLLHVAGGLRRHMLWSATTCWQDLALCAKWARDKEAAVQLGRQGELHHQRVMRHHDAHLREEDVELLLDALREISGRPQEMSIRRSLLHVLPARYVGVLAEALDNNVRLRDDEMRDWADLLRLGRAHSNPLKSLEQVSESARASAVIFENVPGIAEAVLWGGSHEAGYAAGRYLDRFDLSVDEWRMLFAVSRGFCGTLRELGEAAIALLGSRV